MNDKARTNMAVLGFTEYHDPDLDGWWCKKRGDGTMVEVLLYHSGSMQIFAKPHEVKLILEALEVGE